MELKFQLSKEDADLITQYAKNGDELMEAGKYNEAIIEYEKLKRFISSVQGKIYRTRSGLVGGIGTIVGLFTPIGLLGTLILGGSGLKLGSWLAKQDVYDESGLEGIKNMAGAAILQAQAKLKGK